jgi:hypothetical protein
MRERKETRGGSVASDEFNSIPKQAPESLPYSPTHGTLVKANDVVKQYGSVYKTTGGGLSESKAYKFVHKFIDNRVLDLYLKYLGITTLTPTTLVPIALIFGQAAFRKAFRHIRKQEQKGGKIPVLDNNLVGTYLKLAGLSQLSLGLNTLVPLGLAMAIWQAFTKRKQQRGGHIGKLLTGASVPAGYLQLGRMYWNGESVQNNLASPLSAAEQLHRPMSYINHEMQIPCQGDSCSLAGLPSPPNLDHLKTNVAGIGKMAHSAKNVLAVKPLNQDLVSSEDHYKQITGSQSGLYLDGSSSSLVMRNQMAGGSSCGSSELVSRTSIVGPPTAPDQFDVPTSQFGGKSGRRRVKDFFHGVGETIRRHSPRRRRHHKSRKSSTRSRSPFRLSFRRSRSTPDVHQSQPVQTREPRSERQVGRVYRDERVSRKSVPSRRMRSPPTSSEATTSTASSASTESTVPSLSTVSTSRGATSSRGGSSTESSYWN